VQENIDLIKLQRDVKEKSTRLIALQEKYAALEEVSLDGVKCGNVSSTQSQSES
jgi:hypothetical protein